MRLFLAVLLAATATISITHAAPREERQFGWLFGYGDSEENNAKAVKNKEIKESHPYPFEVPFSDRHRTSVERRLALEDAPRRRGFKPPRPNFSQRPQRVTPNRRVYNAPEQLEKRKLLLPVISSSYTSTNIQGMNGKNDIEIFDKEEKEKQQNSFDSKLDEVAKVEDIEPDEAAEEVKEPKLEETTDSEAVKTAVAADSSKEPAAEDEKVKEGNNDATKPEEKDSEEPSIDYEEKSPYIPPLPPTLDSFRSEPAPLSEANEEDPSTKYQLVVKEIPETREETSERKESGQIIKITNSLPIRFPEVKEETSPSSETPQIEVTVAQGESNDLNKDKEVLKLQTESATGSPVNPENKPVSGSPFPIPPPPPKGRPFKKFPPKRPFPGGRPLLQPLVEDTESYIQEFIGSTPFGNAGKKDGSQDEDTPSFFDFLPFIGKKKPTKPEPNQRLPLPPAPLKGNRPGRPLGRPDKPNGSYPPFVSQGKPIKNTISRAQDKLDVEPVQLIDTSPKANLSTSSDNEPTVQQETDKSDNENNDIQTDEPEPFIVTGQVQKPTKKPVILSKPPLRKKFPPPPRPFKRPPPPPPAAMGPLEMTSQTVIGLAKGVLPTIKQTPFLPKHPLRLPPPLGPLPKLPSLGEDLLQLPLAVGNSNNNAKKQNQPPPPPPIPQQPSLPVKQQQGAPVPPSDFFKNQPQQAHLNPSVEANVNNNDEKEPGQASDFTSKLSSFISSFFKAGSASKSSQQASIVEDSQGKQPPRGPPSNRRRPPLRPLIEPREQPSIESDVINSLFSDDKEEPSPTTAVSEDTSSTSTENLSTSSTTTSTASPATDEDTFSKTSTEDAAVEAETVSPGEIKSIDVMSAPTKEKEESSTSLPTVPTTVRLPPPANSFSRIRPPRPLTPKLKKPVVTSTLPPPIQGLVDQYAAESRPVKPPPSVIADIERNFESKKTIFEKFVTIDAGDKAFVPNSEVGTSDWSIQTDSSSDWTVVPKAKPVVDLPEVPQEQFERKTGIEPVDDSPLEAEVQEAEEPAAEAGTAKKNTPPQYPNERNAEGGFRPMLEPLHSPLS